MADGATNIQRLQRMANNAQDTLVSARTVFPFVLFPDDITIDRVKVTVTRRTFFKVEEVISIQIEDILNVEADTGPFFGSIKIWTRFYVEEPLRITFLKRNQTLMIKRVLQGYIIARHKNIDCSGIEKEDLVPILHKLGLEAGELAAVSGNEEMTAEDIG